MPFSKIALGCEPSNVRQVIVVVNVRPKVHRCQQIVSLVESLKRCRHETYRYET